MEKRTTHADGGAIRIYSNGFAVQFSAGSGDGRYTIYLHTDSEDAWSGEIGSGNAGFGRFVGGFEVSEGATVCLAAHDCESTDPLYSFPAGRWFVYHDPDEYRVAIARLRD